MFMQSGASDECVSIGSGSSESDHGPCFQDFGPCIEDIPADNDCSSTELGHEQEWPRAHHGHGVQVPWVQSFLRVVIMSHRDFLIISNVAAVHGVDLEGHVVLNPKGLGRHAETACPQKYVFTTFFLHAGFPPAAR